MIPITIEEVLTQALETLQSFPEISQETLIRSYCAEHPAHAEELTELIPVMVLLDQERLWRAVERTDLVGMCEQFAGVKAG